MFEQALAQSRVFSEIVEFHNFPEIPQFPQIPQSILVFVERYGKVRRARLCGVAVSCFLPALNFSNVASPVRDCGQLRLWNWWKLWNLADIVELPESSEIRRAWKIPGSREVYNYIGTVEDSKRKANAQRNSVFIVPSFSFKFAG